MDTKKLRQKLLDLAIRGKLVPQDPSDEHASELLARIHEEKLAMIERGELKPKDVKNDTVIYFGSDGLPYEKRADGKGKAKCIADEVPFTLPEGWSWARVNTVCPVGTGATPLKANKSYYENGTISWITSSSATKGTVVKPDGYITELALNETNCTVYPAGSLVVAMYGEGKTRGSIATMQIDAATNQACAVLRKIENGCLQSYIKICYENSYDALRDKAQGGNQPNLNQSVVSGLLIPVPPLAEQQHIVAALDKYLALVDEVERDRSELDDLHVKLKSKVLDLAIRGQLTRRDPDDEPASELLARIREEKLAMVERGELRPKDVRSDTVIFTGSDGLRYEKPADGKGKAKCIEGEIPFEIPEGWSWARLGCLVQLTSGIDLAKAEYNSENKGIPYITGASNFKKGFLLENRWTEAPKRVSRKGDLLFTCKGTVGEMAINRFASAHIARQVMAITPYGKISLNYLQRVLTWHVESIKGKAKGFIPGIERGVLLDALVPIPPLAEQRRIAEAIEAAFALTNL